MEEALRFFKANELWIYLLLGLGGLYFLRKFSLSWGELRGAGFGLERENAQARLNQTAIILVLLLLMVVSEFVLVSFIAPSVPSPLLTPTLDLLATPSITLPAAVPGLGSTPAPGETPAAGTPASGPVTPLPATPMAGDGCIPGQISISYPLSGDNVSATVPITGTVMIPNFGFYKIEMKRADETSWQTLLAGNEAKQEGLLGNWNTSLLPPGDYQLGLVVIDNQGAMLPACTLSLKVIPAEETPRP